MNAMRFASAAIVSLASLLLISDTGYSEEIVRQKRALFTPISADFGEDHFHMTLLSYERNLIESETGSYIKRETTSSQKDPKDVSYITAGLSPTFSF